MRRRYAVAAIAVPLVVGGAGVAVAAAPSELRATGRTSVEGTPSTLTFEIADRTIRHVGYVDQGELVYSFGLTNDGPLPVTVEGLSGSMQDPRLFDFLGLESDSGDEKFTIGAGDTEEVNLVMAMTGCESLSARAGSLISEVVVVTAGPLGLRSQETVIALPEELRAGSPREASCANATASSRPPG